MDLHPHSKDYAPHDPTETTLLHSEQLRLVVPAESELQLEVKVVEPYKWKIIQSPTDSLHFLLVSCFPIYQIVLH